LLAIAVAFLVSGCATGVLYTHTFQPLTLDMHRTPVAHTEKTGSIKLITCPRGIGLVAWDSAAIGEVAKKQGLREVDFADLETLSILRIWNEYTIHIYGK
jgi:TRL-like protein family